MRSGSSIYDLCRVAFSRPARHPPWSAATLCGDENGLCQFARLIAVSARLPSCLLIYVLVAMHPLGYDAIILKVVGESKIVVGASFLYYPLAS
jgi:hypothetical protein